ncbi:MAG: arginine N-succinyltransferase, partial [Planctomycetota bacterium]
NASFAAPIAKPSGELYTFVLEDSAHPDKLLGTCSVVSKTGGFEPFYNYELRDERYESDVLGVDKTVQSLHLLEDHNGPSEVGGLFLRPGVRGGGFGRILVVARFLFMAGRPGAFDPRVVAEVRGVTDENGDSPFWDAVGRHFFGVDFATADQLSFKEKKIIADLMPDHPIYVPMLPRSARDVIGVEHDFATPARRLLESEGFAFNQQVDIFDAGPTLATDLKQIRAVTNSQICEIASTDGKSGERADTLVCNDRLDFVGVPADIKVSDGRVRLSEDAAKALGVGVGDSVRLVPLRSAEPVPPRRSAHSDEIDLYGTLPLPQES